MLVQGADTGLLLRRLAISIIRGLKEQKASVGLVNYSIARHTSVKGTPKGTLYFNLYSTELVAGSQRFLSC